MNQILLRYQAPSVQSRVEQYLRELVGQIHAEGKDRLPNEIELAERLGVSRGTVRRAISVLVEETILYRIKNKGTFLNREHVFFLRGNRKIAVVMPEANDSFAIALLSGVQKICLERGYGYLLFFSDNNEQKEEKLLRELRRQDIAGLILFPEIRSHFYNNAALRLIDEEFPLVFIDNYYRDCAVSYICSDNYRGAYEMTKYLFDCGHRDMCFIAYGESRVTTMRDRLRGYSDACRDLLGANTVPNVVTISVGRLSYGETNERPQVDWKEYLDDFHGTAVFASTDLLAASLLGYFQSEGKSVPEQVSIAGFDAMPVSEYTTPRITTVAQNLEQIGRRAGEVLFEKICGKTELVRERVPVRIIERESVRKL